LEKKYIQSIHIHIVNVTKNHLNMDMMSTIYES
jgi:hypothetical protein